LHIEDFGSEPRETPPYKVHVVIGSIPLKIAALRHCSEGLTIITFTVQRAKMSTPYTFQGSH